VSFWVASTIVWQIGDGEGEEEEDLSPKERAQLLAYWIRVLEVLIASSVVEIIYIVLSNSG